MILISSAIKIWQSSDKEVAIQQPDHTIHTFTLNNFIQYLVQHEYYIDDFNHTNYICKNGDRFGCITQQLVNTILIKTSSNHDYRKLHNTYICFAILTSNVISLKDDNVVITKQNHEPVIVTFDNFFSVIQSNGLCVSHPTNQLIYFHIQQPLMCNVDPALIRMHDAKLQLERSRLQPLTVCANTGSLKPEGQVQNFTDTTKKTQAQTRRHMACSSTDVRHS